MSEQPKKTDGLAVTSLILGIIGFIPVGIGILTSLPAIICGHIAKSRIRKSEDLEGEGMALAGLIMGYVQIGIGFFTIPLLLAIAIPSFVQAREQAQTHRTENNIHIICTAVETYRIVNKKLPESIDDLLDNDKHIRYLKVQLDDAWGNPIRYKVDGDTFYVVSPGADMLIGTEDDITN